MNKIAIAVEGTNMVEDAVSIKETAFPTEKVRQIFLDCFEKLQPEAKPMSDNDMLFYIEKKLAEPWRGFTYSEVEFLFRKLSEAGRNRSRGLDGKMYPNEEAPLLNESEVVALAKSEQIPYSEALQRLMPK